MKNPIKKEKWNSKLKKGKIKVRFNPYTYVRTIVMKTLLLDRQDYDKLIKMDFNEISGFLQETDYKKDIDRHAARFSGAQLLEKSVVSNLSSSFEKLKRISSEDIKRIIEEYLKRNDIENIKTVIRGVATKTEASKIADTIIESGTLSREYYESLISMKSMNDVVKGFGIINAEEEGILSLIEEGKSLAEIENVIDKAYYLNLVNFSKKISKQGRIMKEFLSAEMEVTNILTVIRLKKAGKFPKDIEGMVFYMDEKKYDKFLKDLVNSKSIEDIFAIIEKSRFAECVKNGIEQFRKNSSMIDFEIGMKKYLLSRYKLLAHKNMLSIDSILSYMFSKDVEARNLRIIVKGKQLGVGNEFIEKQIIV